MTRVRCQDCKHEELDALNPGVGMSGCKVLIEHWYRNQLHRCIDFASLSDPKPAGESTR